jgi:nucleoid DNA-binding protein
MTKRDLVAQISDETGLPQVQVAKVVEKTLEGITGALSRGEGIELRNFGVFEVRHRKPRMGRNPAKPGKQYPVPARAVVKFKPGKEMKEVVMKLGAPNTSAPPVPSPSSSGNPVQ